MSNSSVKSEHVEAVHTLVIVDLHHFVSFVNFDNLLVTQCLVCS